MRVVLFGPPGSGKGTQGAVISENNGIPLISTGDMLRQAVAEKTVLGKKVEGLLRQGRLVPDDVMISLIEDRVARPDCKEGFILDGFPRTLDQGKALEEVLPDSVDVAVYLNVPREVVIDRLAGRLTCKKCGAVYPKTAERSLCQVCGGDLYQRDDDHRSTVERRMKVYEEHTAPLVEFYRARGKLAEVDGTGTPAEVSRRIEAAIAQVVG